MNYRRSVRDWILIACCLVPTVAFGQPANTAEVAPTRMSIEDALRAAEAASPAVEIAREDVARANEQVTIARSGWLPQLGGTAGYTRTIRSEFEDINFGAAPGMEEIELPFGQRNTWRVGLVLSQSIFDGGRTSSQMKAARAGVRAGEYGVLSAKSQAVLATAQAYYDAVLAQRQVEIGESSLEQAEKTLADTQLSFSKGAAPEFDYLRAEVARDNQRTSLIRFRTQREVAFVAFKRQVGLPLDRPIELTSTLDAQDLEALVAIARTAAGVSGTQRVAVEQAKEVVAIQEGSLGVARADRLPQISALSDLGLVDYESDPFNTDWRTNWTVGVNLSIPIFDGFRRRAVVRSAQSDVRIARAQLRDASDRAGVESIQSDADVAAASATLQSTTRTVEQARRAYQIAELRYQQGASTQLELVDARVQLQASQLNNARSSRDLRVALLRRDLLTGLPLGAGAGSVAGTSAPAF